jgi:cathepsin F/cysteine peptidase B
MKLLLASVAVVSGAVIDSSIVGAFSNFMAEYHKQYSDAEYATRLGVFAQNLERVAEMNKEHILLGGEAVFGVTQFSDLTPAEFKAMYLTFRPGNSSEPRVNVVLDGEPNTVVDWRTKGAVTDVKDQGQCGSCWAFSATEAIESYSFLNDGKLINLSPQQITSCDKTDSGCGGGWPHNAFSYVQKAGGIETSADYPYTSGGGSTGTCKFNAQKVAVKLTGYKSVATGEANLKAAVNNGPPSVCLAAEAFQSYRSGILKSCPGSVDHCVQAVGYDDSNSPPYWTVRNSWATTWGEKGYIRIASGSDLCKIADYVTYPTF